MQEDEILPLLLDPPSGINKLIDSQDACESINF